MYQQLTGDVKRLVGSKGIANAKVTLHIPTEKVMEEAVADEQGGFTFDHFEFPDSTQYNVQSITSKGGDKVLLSLREEAFPKVCEPWPLRKKGNSFDPLLTDQPVSVEFMNKSDRKMRYEDGMRSVFLEDVVVTAKKRVVKTQYETLLNSITLRRKEIEETPMIDLKTFIQSRFPGMYLKLDTLYYREERVRVIFNEFPVYDPVLETNLIQTLTLRDIEQIDFNREKAAGLAWFPMTGAYFIAITLRKDLPRADGLPKNIGFIQLQGYQRPAAFYSPKYETRQQKDSETLDLRTTLYWNPCIHADDQGNAPLEFYTGDGEASFSVVVEGVTVDGKLIRSVKRF